MSWSDPDSLLQAIYIEIDKLFDNKIEKSIYLATVLEAFFDLDMNCEDVEFSDYELISFIEKRSKLVDNHWSEFRKKAASHDRKVLTHQISQAQKKIEKEELELLFSNPEARLCGFTSVWKVAMRVVDGFDARMYFTQSLIRAFHIKVHDVLSVEDDLSDLKHVVHALKSEESRESKILKILIEKDKHIRTLEDAVLEAAKELKLKLILLH